MIVNSRSIYHTIILEPWSNQQIHATAFLLNYPEHRIRSLHDFVEMKIQPWQACQHKYFEGTSATWVNSRSSWYEICFKLDSALWENRSSSRDPQTIVRRSASCLRTQLDKTTHTRTACYQRKGGLLSMLQALGKRKVYSLERRNISWHSPEGPVGARSLEKEEGAGKVQTHTLRCIFWSQLTFSSDESWVLWVL